MCCKTNSHTHSIYLTTSCIYSSINAVIPKTYSCEQPFFEHTAFLSAFEETSQLIVIFNEVRIHDCNDSIVVIKKGSKISYYMLVIHPHPLMTNA